MKKNLTQKLFDKKNNYLIQNTKHNLFPILCDDIYCMWWHLKARTRLLFVRRCSHHCRITHVHYYVSILFFSLSLNSNRYFRCTHIHAVFIQRQDFHMIKYVCTILSRFFCKGGNTWFCFDYILVCAHDII